MISPDMQKKIDIFADYMICDEIGDWVRLSDDAPQKAVDAYEEFCEEQKRAKKKGLKV